MSVITNQKSNQALLMASRRAKLTPDEKAKQRKHASALRKARRAALKAGTVPVKKVKKITTGVRSTAQQIDDTLQLLSNHMKGYGFEADNENYWLKDTRRVVKFLQNKYTNSNTQRTKLAAIVSYLRDREDKHAITTDWEADALVDYRSEMNLLIAEIARRAGNNTKSVATASNWVDWDDIKKAKKKIAKDPLSQLVYALYTQLNEGTPRRTEYRTLKLRKYTKKAYETEVRKNTSRRNILWMTNSKTPRPRNITLGDYKGSLSKGVYEIKKLGATAKLFKALTDDKQNGDFLFPISIREPSRWSYKVGDVFERALGRRVGINILRKSYNTFLQGTQPSLNVKKSAALRMGTSVGIADANYTKLDE